MGPSPHLWFLDAKPQLLDQNNKFLRVPDITCCFVVSKQHVLWVPAFMCGFCLQNRDFWTRITSLYGSQTSPVVLCIQNNVICNSITGLYGFQPSSVVLCLQNCAFRARITILCGSQTPPVVFPCKTATSGTE